MDKTVVEKTIKLAPKECFCVFPAKDPWGDKGFFNQISNFSFIFELAIFLHLFSNNWKENQIDPKEVLPCFPFGRDGHFYGLKKLNQECFWIINFCLQMKEYWEKWTPGECIPFWGWRIFLFKKSDILFLKCQFFFSDGAITWM